MENVTYKGTESHPEVAESGPSKGEGRVLE